MQYELQFLTRIYKYFLIMTFAFIGYFLLNKIVQSYLCQRKNTHNMLYLLRSYGDIH